MQTVAVTGGNGTIGRHLLAHLADEGYRTVNVSRGSRREDVATDYLRTDLLDAGEVYGAVAKSDADAVVHLGMIPDPDGTPGYVTFRSNVLSTYHVLEAASALDVGSVCLASSLCAMGAGFEPEPIVPRYLPLDEDHPLSPSNPYGLGKQVLEVTADGVARRDQAPDIASFRFPWTVDDETMRSAFVEPDRSLAAVRESDDFHSERNSVFSYVHVDDATRAIRLALEADLTGHERFFLSAPDTALSTDTPTVVDDVYPDATVLGDLTDRQALVDTTRAAETLDWTADRSWRDLRR